MTKIRDIMQTRLVTVEASELLGRARELMRAHQIDHLPVLSKGDLVGVLSKRDAFAVNPEDDSGLLWDDDAAIERVMSRPAAALHPEATIAVALAFLRRRGIGCVPIVEDGELVGIVTRMDLRNAAREDASPIEDGRPPPWSRAP